MVPECLRSSEAAQARGATYATRCVEKGVLGGCAGFRPLCPATTTTGPDVLNLSSTRTFDSFPGSDLGPPRQQGRLASCEASKPSCAPAQLGFSSWTSPGPHFATIHGQQDASLRRRTRPAQRLSGIAVFPHRPLAVRQTRYPCQLGPSRDNSKVAHGAHSRVCTLRHTMPPTPAQIPPSPPHIVIATHVWCVRERGVVEMDADAGGGAEPAREPTLPPSRRRSTQLTRRLGAPRASCCAPPDAQAAPAPPRRVRACVLLHPRHAAEARLLGTTQRPRPIYAMPMRRAKMRTGAGAAAGTPVRAGSYARSYNRTAAPAPGNAHTRIVRRPQRRVQGARSGVWTERALCTPVAIALSVRVPKVMFDKTNTCRRCRVASASGSRFPKWASSSSHH
ncbi:hypothetical protein B0H11DRAFT_2342829 [Mycena galericulata]|nr:hypothetical protein B0H11DRAFT_2342829 [Mycena galericulata]